MSEIAVICFACGMPVGPDSVSHRNEVPMAEPGGRRPPGESRSPPGGRTFGPSDRRSDGSRSSPAHCSDACRMSTASSSPNPLQSRRVLMGAGPSQQNVAVPRHLLDAYGGPVSLGAATAIRKASERVECMHPECAPRPHGMHLRDHPELEKSPAKPERRCYFCYAVVSGEAFRVPVSVGGSTMVWHPTHCSARCVASTVDELSHTISTIPASIVTSASLVATVYGPTAPWMHTRDMLDVHGGRVSSAAVARSVSNTDRKDRALDEVPALDGCLVVRLASPREKVAVRPASGGGNATLARMSRLMSRLPP